MATPQAISSDLGRLGSHWMLNLRRINVKNAQVVARSSRKVYGNLDDLILSLPSAVAELFGIKIEPPSAEEIAKLTRGTLSVKSKPKGANVLVDEEFIGLTPLEKSLSPGKYVIRIKIENHEPKEKEVYIGLNKTTRLSLILQEDYPMNPYKKWGYVSFFSGVGLAAFGGVSTILAKSAADDAQNNGNWSGEDTSRAWEIGMGVGYGLGGAAMLTGIILWSVSPGDKAWWEENNLAVGVTDGNATVSLSGRW